MPAQTASRQRTRIRTLLGAALAAALVMGGCSDSSTAAKGATESSNADTVQTTAPAVDTTTLNADGSTDPTVPVPVTSPPENDVICEAHSRPDGGVAHVVNIAPQSPSGGLTVHETPDENATILATLPLDTEVSTTTGDEDCVVAPTGVVWWLVTSDDGQSGWANADFLSRPGAG